MKYCEMCIAEAKEIEVEYTTRYFFIMAEQYQCDCGHMWVSAEQEFKLSQKIQSELESEIERLASLLEKQDKDTKELFLAAKTLEEKCVENALWCSEQEELRDVLAKYKGKK